MHLQILNFNLSGIDEGQWRETARELGPSFAEIPGLLAKVWVNDPESNTYGAVYLWSDRGAMEDFTKGELFRAVESHPNLTNITSKDFGVYEDLTKATQPGLTIVS